MAILFTNNLNKKKLVRLFFNDKVYHNIKLWKIILDFVVGKDYEDIYKIYPKLIHESDIVLDIGANMGQYACRLSRYIKNGKIYSFEPVLVNFYHLNKMIKLLKLNRVDTLNLAISDRVGVTDINIPIINGKLIIATQAVLKECTKHYYTNVSYKTERVKVNTIDNLFVELCIEKVDLIKVDTEGAEIQVLRGGNEIIKKFKPILALEINHDNPGLKYLYNYGYDPYYYDSKMDRLINFSMMEYIKHYPGNLILIHKGNNIRKLTG